MVELAHEEFLRSHPGEDVQCSLWKMLTFDNLGNHN